MLHALLRWTMSESIGRMPACFRHHRTSEREPAVTEEYRRSSNPSVSRP